MRRLLIASIALALTPAVARAQETVEYYGTDALGSIRVVFDQSGGITARTDYLPFGEEVNSTAVLPAERFTGQARDGEAGLDYFNARMLQPRVGRFSAPDPVAGSIGAPQTWNRYGYALANPTGLKDPSGLSYVTVSCGAGPQWCPGNFKVGPDSYASSDAQFDSSSYGYHGGEAAAAEASYAASVDAAFFANSDWGKVQNSQDQPHGDSTVPLAVGFRTIKNPFLRILSLGFAKHSYFSITGDDGVTHQFEVLGQNGRHDQQVEDTFGEGARQSHGSEVTIFVTEAQAQALIIGSQNFLTSPCPTCTGGEEGYNFLTHNSNSFVYNMLGSNPAGPISPPPAPFFTAAYGPRPDEWYPKP